MPTLKELMGDLKRGDGRKFKSEYYSAHQWFEPIYKSDVGIWYGLCENGSNFFSGEDHCENWQPYSKPNTKKKIKLYSPVGKSQQGYIYLFGKYADKKEWFGEGGETIIGWHEIEVEVDE